MAENNKKYRFETLQLHVGQEQADPATIHGDRKSVV